MTVRIGFVGAGFMGQVAHLRNYDRVAGCEVVALAEPRAERARLVADRYDIPAVYADHEELVDEATVDAIVAPQPYDRYAFVVPDLLSAGVPLFTEKPLAVAPETGERLADLGEREGVPHMVGYHKRADPAMEYAARLLDEWRETGAYGSQRFVRITMPPGEWIAGAPDPITTDEEPPDAETESIPVEFEGDAAEAYDHTINYYVHQLNGLRLLFGEPYEVAYADAAGALMVAESESGVTGTLERDPYETSNDWQESVLVGFERGYVRVDLPPPLISQRAGRVEVMRDDDPTATTEPAMPPVAAMRRQAEHFVAVARGEREPPCDAREAAEDLRIARDYVRARYD